MNDNADNVVGMVYSRGETRGRMVFWEQIVLFLPVGIGHMNFKSKIKLGVSFYFPSTSFQKAAGGFGGFIINNREVIPVPFGTPDGDITIFIGDWYTKSHKV